MASFILPDNEKAILVPQGAMLKAKREERRLTAAFVATQLKMSADYLYKIEGGKMRASDIACDRLEAFYKLKPNTLRRLGQSSGRKPGASVVRKTTNNELVVKKEDPPLESPPLNREQLMTALLRIQAELASLGVEDLTITASHGEFAIEVSTDTFSVKRK